MKNISTPDKHIEIEQILQSKETYVSLGDVSEIENLIIAAAICFTKVCSQTCNAISLSGRASGKVSSHKIQVGAAVNLQSLRVRKLTHFIRTHAATMHMQH